MWRRLQSPPSSRAMEAIDYAGLLDPAHLANEQAIKSSLQMVEQHLTEENCIAVVEEILSIANPQSTAIFLSGKCHWSATDITKYVCWLSSQA